MKIPENLLNKLSFPDFAVEKIIFNYLKKKINIFVEGAFLDIDDGIILSKGVLCIVDFSNIIGRLFFDNKWKLLSFNNFEQLKSIEEFIVEKDVVYLRGFGEKSGCWIEYKILNPRIKANFKKE